MKKMVLNTLNGALFGAIVTVVGVTVGGLFAQSSFADDAVVAKIDLPREIGAGFIEKATVHLDRPAGEGGVVVYLATDQTAYLAHPTRVFIREGDDYASFPIRATEQTKSRIAKFGASTGDDGVLATTRLRAAPPQSRTLMQRSVPVRYRVWD